MSSKKTASAPKPTPVPTPAAAPAPVGTAVYDKPAQIQVETSLAQDTLKAQAFAIAETPNSVALFSNPFSEGREEMLFIHGATKAAMWATQSNKDGNWKAITLPKCDKPCLGVICFVHPDKSVWAFVSTVDGTIGANYLLKLVPLYNPEGQLVGSEWKEQQNHLGDPEVHAMGVQYLNDRMSSAIVWFLTYRTPTNRTLELHVQRSSMKPGLPWEHLARHTLNSLTDDERKRATFAVGADSDLKTVRAFAALSPDPVKGFYVDVASGKETDLTFGTVVATRMVGTWSHPSGVAGFIGQDESARYKPISYYAPLLSGSAFPEVLFGEVFPSTPERDLTDTAAWQDADGLLHIYGRSGPVGGQKSLCVIHQKGWRPATVDNPILAPVWDGVTDDNVDYAFTRPIAAKVAAFALDAYPDKMPDQFVLHSATPLNEACVLYSQSLDGQYWSNQTMRIMNNLSGNQIVSRYLVAVTVKDGYGAPMSGIEVSVTADNPIDMEARGAYYRVGPATPVRVVTDMLGRVVLRINATDLVMPRLHLSAPGVEHSATINPAAAIHNFLGGQAPLPNHQAGFTPEVIANATIVGTSQPLFPGLRSPTHPLQPSAEDVALWCTEALSSKERKIAGMRFQVRNPGRKVFEVYETAVQHAAARAADPDDIYPVLAGWAGDFWQAVRNGAVTVWTVDVDFENGLVKVLADFQDGLLFTLTQVWDTLKGAAEAVALILRAVGGKGQEVLDWLTWAFGFRDVLIATKALNTVMGQAPRLMADTLADIGTVPHNFFVGLEDKVKTSFNALKISMAGSTFASLQGETAHVPAEYVRTEPALGGTGDMLRSPHSSWLTDMATDGLLGDFNVGQNTTITNLLNSFPNTLFAVPVFDELSKAFQSLAELFTNLFSGKDPASILAMEVISVLELAEHLILFILKLLDQICSAAIEWCKLAIPEIANVLNDTSIANNPIISALWTFVVDQSGLDPKDYPLTLGMFGAFFAAYPFTVVQKALTGKAPFATGDVIPVPPKRGEAWRPATMPGDTLDSSLAHYQAFQGVIQTMDLIMDGWMDAHVLLQNTPYYFYDVTSGWSRFFAVAHTIAYTVGDHPWFWGYDPFSKYQPPYYRYFFTFMFNVTDLFMAFKYKKLQAMFEGADDDPPDVKAKKQLVYMLVTNAYGMVRIGINCFEYWEAPYRNEGKPHSWYDLWNLWINLTAYIQTATGFVRFVAREIPTPYSKGALVFKMIVDVIGDAYSGICTVRQPMTELRHPPKIDVTDGPVRFEAVRYQPYSSDLIQVLNGAPGFDWDTLPAAGSDSFSLPNGLSLVTPNYNSDFGQTVQLSGIPMDVFPETNFQLRVTDNYGPSSTAVHNCVMVVKPEPTGIPVADFSVTPQSGSAGTMGPYGSDTDGLAVDFRVLHSASVDQTRWYLDGELQEQEGGALISWKEYFSVAGTYAVTLAVKNQYGWSAPVTQQLIVTAVEGTPVASFSFNQNPGMRVLTMTQFTDTSSGQPDAWYWDFGDGSPVSTEQNPEHVWKKGGTFTVTLIARNKNGWGLRAQQTAVVAWLA